MESPFAAQYTNAVRANLADKLLTAMVCAALVEEASDDATRFTPPEYVAYWLGKATMACEMWEAENL
jgi:hypothetical protein